MADYYTKFGVVVALKDADEQQYALNLEKEARELKLMDDDSQAGDFPESLLVELEDWDFELEPHEHGLWVYSIMGTGFEAACAFIHHLLQKFKSKEFVYFKWSTGSMPFNEDALGGGAAVISADEVLTINASDWLNATLDAVNNRTQGESMT